MDGYVVDYLEAHELQNEWLLAKRQLDDAIESLQAAIAMVECVSSFQGEGADAAKRYFHEVHGEGILPKLELLAETLSRDCAIEYFQGFGSGAVSEARADARWAWGSMSKTEVASWSVLNGGKETLETIEKDVRKAVEAAADAGFSYSAPNASNLRAALQEEAMQTQKVRDGVSAVEERGVSAFKAKASDFNAVRKALAKTIKAWRKSGMSVTDYTTGAFSSIPESKSLAKAMQGVEERVKGDADAVFSIQKNAYIASMSHYEQTIDDAIEKKIRQLEGLYYVLIVEIGLGLVELVTAGSATPVIALLMSVISVDLQIGEALDTAALIRQLKDGSAQDIRVVDENGEKVLKVGNKTLSTSQDVIEAYEKYSSGKFDEVIDGFSEEIQKKVNDEVLDELEKQGLISKEELKVVKTTYKESKSFFKDAVQGNVSGVSVGKGGSRIVESILEWRIADTDGVIARNQDNIERYDDLAKDFGLDARDMKYSPQGKTCELVTVSSGSSEPRVPSGYEPGRDSYNPSRANGASSYEFSHYGD